MVDKSTIGKKIIFRFEIWMNPNLPSNKVEELKNKLAKDYGCSGITIKEMK